MGPVSPTCSFPRSHECPRHDDDQLGAGEDVLVRERFHEPGFSLGVISSSVKTVRLRVEKE